MRVFIRRNYDILLMGIFLAAVLLATAISGHAQSSTTLSRKCAGAAPSPARSLVDLEKDGDINILPCSGRSISINGSGTSALITSFNGLTAATQLLGAPIANDTASWSSVTATHTLRLPITGVTGSARTSFFSYFDAQNTLAKSAATYNGTSAFTWDNSAGTSTFPMALTTTSAAGSFSVGNASSSQISMSQGGNSVAIRAQAQAALISAGGTASIGSIAANRVEVNDTAGTITFVGNFTLDRTITAIGTTGNQTINKHAGTINVAAAAGAVTLTDSFINANSLIWPSVRTADATCTFVKSIVAGAGSAVITMNANCTAATSIGFWVTN